MLTLTRRKVTKVVTVLTDPNPLFVSLVTRGANGTPFKSVKVADLTEVKPEIPMQTTVKKDEGPIAGKGIHVNKIVFPSDKFPDDASVKKFMDQYGYNNFRQEVLDGTRIAKGIDESAFDSIAPITTDEGATFFAGKLREGYVLPEIEVPATKGSGDMTSGDLKPVATAPAGAATPPAAPVSTPPSQPQTVPPVQTPPVPGPVVPVTPPVQEPPSVPAKKEEVTENGTRIRTKAGPEGPSGPVGPTGPELTIPVRKKEGQTRVVKYADYYGYYGGDGQTIGEVLADNADGIPIGYSDLHGAFVAALRRKVLAGDVAGVTTLTNEFGTIIQKLATLTATAEKSELPKVVEALLGAEDPTTGTVKKVETPPVVAAPAVPASEVEAAVQKALAPLQDKLSKSEARIAELEAPVQTRKSVGAQDAAPAGETTKKDEGDEASRALRRKAVWGITTPL